MFILLYVSYTTVKLFKKLSHRRHLWNPSPPCEEASYHGPECPYMFLQGMPLTQSHEYPLSRPFIRFVFVASNLERWNNYSLLMKSRHAYCLLQAWSSHMQCKLTAYILIHMGPYCVSPWDLGAWVTNKYADTHAACCAVSNKGLWLWTRSPVSSDNIQKTLTGQPS